MYRYRSLFLSSFFAAAVVIGYSWLNFTPANDQTDTSISSGGFSVRFGDSGYRSYPRYYQNYNRDYNTDYYYYQYPYNNGYTYYYTYPYSDYNYNYQYYTYPRYQYRYSNDWNYKDRPYKQQNFVRHSRHR
ncbi:MAG: hypothetical protein Q8K75_05400 [Chlamydiales bacterium]|nr:hypothetical protein [Chlamydiales bacterium]